MHRSVIQQTKDRTFHKVWKPKALPRANSITWKRESFGSAGKVRMRGNNFIAFDCIFVRNTIISEAETNETFQLHILCCRLFILIHIFSVVCWHNTISRSQILDDPILYGRTSTQLIQTTRRARNRFIEYQKIIKNQTKLILV